jgi:hypothetical protein
MNSTRSYVVRRNVGTVGRPPLACAVCAFTPSGHILSAVPALDDSSEADEGLCNIHAQGLGQNEAVSASRLDDMRNEWRAQRAVER